MLKLSIIYLLSWATNFRHHRRKWKSWQIRFIYRRIWVRYTSHQIIYV